MTGDLGVEAVREAIGRLAKRCSNRFPGSPGKPVTLRLEEFENLYAGRIGGSLETKHLYDEHSSIFYLIGIAIGIY